MRETTTCDALFYHTYTSLNDSSVCDSTCEGYVVNVTTSPFFLAVKLVQNDTGHGFIGVMLEARYEDPSQSPVAVGKFRIAMKDMGTLKLVCYDVG